MADEAVRTATGSCLCGAVRFTIRGTLNEVSFCHCLMCQRVSSNYVAYAVCEPDAVEVEGKARLRWYRSSPAARRGFCSRCGSQLFWEPSHGRHLSVSAGSLDQPTGLVPGRHLFCDQAADFSRASPDWRRGAHDPSKA